MQAKNHAMFYGQAVFYAACIHSYQLLEEGLKGSECGSDRSSNIGPRQITRFARPERSTGRFVFEPSSIAILPQNRHIPTVLLLVAVAPTAAESASFS
jgi:hypothetical protein